MPTDLFTTALLALTALAAFTDSRTGLIPNWLTLPALALAPLLQWAYGGGTALSTSLIGVVLCALIPLLLFRAGAMGGGDVKLLAAIGAIAGPLRGLELQLLAYNVLVLFACIVLACQGQLVPALRRTWRLLASLGRQRDASQPLATFRLGLPIFLSACTLLAVEAGR